MVVKLLLPIGGDVGSTAACTRALTCCLAGAAMCVPAAFRAAAVAVAVAAPDWL
jgi:hypothetical protein